MDARKKPEFFGQDEVLNSRKCGMPKSHLTALQEVAYTLNQPILIRPVSIYAHYFLEHGYPTKSFAVKNKSSKSGPMAGLVSIDPKYGRCKDEDAVKKHNKDLLHAYDDDPNLKSTDLYLTLERIDELQKEPLNALKATQNEDKSIALEWDNNGQKYTGTAKFDPKTQMYQILDSEGKPIQVLGRKLNQELTVPITADYDLFLVPPSFAEFDPGLQDQTPHRVQNRDTKEIRSSVLNPILNKEKEGKGNISPRLDILLAVLNNTIARHDVTRQKVKKIKNKTEAKTKSIAMKAFWQPKSPLQYTIHLHPTMEGDGPFNAEKFEIKTSDTPLPLLVKYINNKNKKASFYFYQSINDKIHMTPVDLNDITTLNFDKPQFHEVRKADSSKKNLTLKEKENNILHNRLAYKEYHLRSMNPAIFKENISILPGLEVIHHNQEMQSPFAENLEGNLPLLAILPPYGENKESVACLATEKSQVGWIWNHLQNQGFYLTTPKQYAASLPKFRSPITDEDFKKIRDRKIPLDDKKTVQPVIEEQSQPLIAPTIEQPHEQPPIAPAGVAPMTEPVAAAIGAPQPQTLEPVAIAPPATPGDNVVSTPDGKATSMQSPIEIKQDSKPSHQRFASQIPRKEQKHQRFASTAATPLQEENIMELMTIINNLEMLDQQISYILKNPKPVKEGEDPLAALKKNANNLYRNLKALVKIFSENDTIPKKDLAYFTQKINNYRTKPWREGKYAFLLGNKNKPHSPPSDGSQPRSKSPKR